MAPPATPEAMTLELMARPCITRSDSDLAPLTSRRPRWSCYRYPKSYCRSRKRPMPHSSDDPPSPPTASAETETPSATAGDAPDPADPAGSSSQGGEAYQPHRRRRRRRRRPPPSAAAPGAAVPGETAPQEPPSAGDTVQDMRVDAQGDIAGDAQAPKPRRHRRRRHGPPREMSQPSPVSADIPVDESAPPDPTTVTSGEDFEAG